MYEVQLPRVRFVESTNVTSLVVESSVVKSSVVKTSVVENSVVESSVVESSVVKSSDVSLSKVSITNSKEYFFGTGQQNVVARSHFFGECHPQKPLEKRFPIQSWKQTGTSAPWWTQFSSRTKITKIQDFSIFF